MMFEENMRLEVAPEDVDQFLDWYAGLWKRGICYILLAIILLGFALCMGLRVLYASDPPPADHQ